jgi:hypothetical protein
MNFILIFSVALCVFFVELCVTNNYKFHRVPQRNRRVPQRIYEILFLKGLSFNFLIF